MPKPTNHSAIMRSRRTDYATRTEGDDLIVEGHFIVFDQPYYEDEYCEEVVSPEAIDDATDTSDVRALTDHLSHLVLGRSTAQTFSWKLDAHGLFGTIRINAKDTDATNLYARVQRGDVDQASFGFDADAVEWADLPDGRIRRTIRHISKLWECSVCTFPAYEQTSLSARSKGDEELRKEVLRRKKEKLKRRFRHHES